MGFVVTPSSFPSSTINFFIVCGGERCEGRAVLVPPCESGELSRGSSLEEGGGGVFTGGRFPLPKVWRAVGRETRVLPLSIFSSMEVDSRIGR
jgi:hypothetical protein